MTLSAAFTDFVMAMERVEQCLRRVTRALDDAGIPYAVVGGNAVAAWVARVDPGSTRTTRDVDLLVRREDADRISAAITALGLRRDDMRRLVLFVDPAEPSRRAGVRLVWAAGKVRPSYAHAAPDVSEAVREPGAFAVLGLPALVRMKLTSFRPIDRVHVADLLGIGLIDDRVRAGLPPDLRARLIEIEKEQEPD